MATAARITDSDFTTAQVNSDIRLDTPIPGVATVYIAQQDFVQSRSSYTPIAIGTAHPTLSNFYLQKETELQPVGPADIMRWTRIYAKVPAQHSLPTSVAYPFIGKEGAFTNVSSLSSTILGRPRRTKTVAGKIVFDYFLLDGITYTTVFDIPIIDEQKYFLAGGVTDTIALGMTTDFIGYSQSSATPQLIYDLTHNAASAFPTREAYESLVAARTPIVAVASQPDLWLGYGNIVRRQTTYIIPE